MATAPFGDRVVAQFTALVALAVVASAAWPLAPETLPMHAGFGGFDNFASSWIVLIVVPWACAVAASYDLLPSRRRVGGRLAPVPLLVALADVLLVVAFLAL